MTEFAGESRNAERGTDSDKLSESGRVQSMRLLTRLLLSVALLPVALCVPGGAQEKAQSNAAWDGVNGADVESAVRLICSEKNMTRGKNGQVDGCRVCPDGTSFAGDDASKLELYTKIPGHFTSAKADNLILSTSGCEPHAANFGGSYMFAIADGKTRLVRYNAGLITDQCHKFSFTDGRDYLVCRGGWAGQGEVDDTVSMTAFTAAGKPLASTLLSIRDTRGECRDESQSARESEIKGIQFTPPESAQITGLTITATLGNVSCASIERPGRSRAKAKAGAVKTYDLEFVFDGKGFKVTPGSRTALNRLTPSE